MADIQGKHSLMLENRRKLTLSGITDVDSFDERAVCLFTQLGELTVHGNNLHVNEMSVQTGDITIEGDISALVYGDKQQTKKLGFWGKVFK